MTQTAKALYQRLKERREPFLRRAYRASKLTIPSLLPERREGGVTRHDELPTPYQAVGARGVNNIASKLLLSLLPTSQPFARLVLDPRLRADLEAEDPEGEILTEVEESLAEIERMVTQEVEVLAIRVPVFEALKHLICTGNELLYLPDKDDNLRLFHLDSYVVERAPNGTLLQLVTREEMAPSQVPVEILEKLGVQMDAQTPGGATAYVELFTWVRREGNRWLAHQEYGPGEMVPDSEGSWTEEAFPYLPLRLSSVAGEDYGRGLVEEYEGDLRSLEGLWTALVQAAAASARLLGLVNPAGTTRVEELARTPNGGFAKGNAEDVTFLQVDKHADMRVALEAAARIEERLSRAFLLNSAVTRDAERVTAEEIRFQAQELEASLGGVYSILTQDFQLPLVNRLLTRMRRQKKLPALKKGMVHPTIVTGLDALGRGQDFERLRLATQSANELYGPAEVAKVTKSSVGIKRIFTAAGVDTDGLLRSDEEIAQIEQQAQMQQLTDSLGPDVIRAANQQALQEGQEVDG